MSPSSTPPSALTVETRYENLMQMFGGRGAHFVKTVPQLKQAVTEALRVTDAPSIINVIINPGADRKPQSFNWLTESKL